MKKNKLKFTGVMMLTGYTLIMTSVSAYASEVPQIQQQKIVSQQQMILNISDNILEGQRSENGDAKGIFTTKYRVSVKKATMRSGPGTNYPSLGTLYKDDVVWVQSISNGWAKFKVNSKWHYISTNYIKKATA